jgi:copper chaperone
MQTTSFEVRGMTCGGCTSSVQRAISQLDGVTRAEVSLHPGIATVVADPARVTTAQIQAAITKLGYAATVRPS